MTKCLKMARCVVLAALLLPCVTLLHAQEIEVPINVQYVLLHKILAFDRNLKERVGKELVIGIIFQSNFRYSLNFKDELGEVIAKSQTGKLVDIPVRYVTIAWTENLNLSEYGAKNKIDIFYVAPLRAVEIKTITAASQAQKILTFTGVPAYVDAGVAVGVGAKGESPRIIINLPSAKAEGVEFSSQLLKLAKVIE